MPPSGSATTSSKVNEDVLIKPRPSPNPELFERQSSFRMPMPATNPNAFRRFNSVRGDFVSKTTDGIRTLFNEPIHEGEDEQEVDPKMRTSTSLQFNVGSEANKENSTGVPFFPQGIANPGLQDTPKHRPLSAIASTQPLVNGDSRIRPDNGAGFNAANMSTKADEWLTQMFTASLSFGNNGAPQSYNAAPSAFPPSDTRLTNGLNDFNTASAYSQMPRSFSSDNCRASYAAGYNCGPPPQQPPPPLPPSLTMPLAQPAGYTTTYNVGSSQPQAAAVLNGGYQIPPSSLACTSMAQVPAQQLQAAAAGNGGPTEPQAASAQVRTHSRKSSASNRKSIEYQLLEEVDAPQSPPRVRSPQCDDAPAAELDIFGQPVFTPSKRLGTVADQASSQDDARLTSRSEDPFDVKWSTLVLETTSARSTSPSLSARSQRTDNPFTAESAPVNI